MYIVPFYTVLASEYLCFHCIC